ncbi:MAG: type 2 isopentenyl-diphosphate Delta-isomerase [Anaerolineales bacterium]|jgi:isopentenyl-diphosphate delta-isomerase
MAKVTQISSRKSDHIRINLEENVSSGLTTGLERFQFIHEALPEIDMEEIDLNVEVFGKKLRSPLLISSITGGTKEAHRINLNLATAAQEKGVAMGVGSQRAAIEDPSLAESFQVRVSAPDILLFANLGAVQLNYGYGVTECQKAVDMIEADGLILHFNPLQEAIQPEGDTKFGNLLSKIESVCTALSIPVIAKEVGWGFSGKTAHQLMNAGISAIDVAGAGGTSWTQVEMYRANNERQANLAKAFIDWGIPTADSIQMVKDEIPEMIIFASGGLRTGVDVAKSIALGATLGGLASPFLHAANVSSKKVVQVIEDISNVIKICMFSTGNKYLEQLTQTGLIKR